jgi:sulfotransferase family protein
MTVAEPCPQNPYVFIVGCPRSGTSLLKRMLNAHSQIAVFGESHWIVQLFEEQKGLTPQGLSTPELISHLVNSPKFNRLRISSVQLETLLATPHPVTYSAFIARIFDMYGQSHGKALVGNKTPWFVRRIHTLHTLWPRARFVHLIRDGRDVCLSMGNWPTTHRNHPALFSTWNEDTISTAAFWWEYMVQTGREAGRSLGPDLYYEIRYESLVSHPAEECSRLCAFLRLPYDGAMLSCHEGQTKPIASRPVTQGLRDWRSQMSSDEIARFEGAAGGLLNELGYPRVFPDSASESVSGAAKIRTLLAQDPAWRDHTRESRLMVNDYRFGSQEKELNEIESH